jgi:hypothetical protein
MAVITISLIESPIEVVEGIPQTVSLSTNIYSTIFYTLDGEDPNTSSSIYVSPIRLPTDEGSVVLKVFATNGVDESSIISFTFGSTFVPLRRPRDTVKTDTLYNFNDNRAFSSQSSDLKVIYGNTGGYVVDSPDIIGIPDGYDGTGTGTSPSETDLPYNRENYEIKYSLTDNKGQTGRGIGTLPANVVIEEKLPPPTSTDANSKFFNPKAMVIFQDGREEPELGNVPLINRQFFSLGDDEKIRNGSMYYTTALDGNSPTGSMLVPRYNPREDTWTYYYRDSETNRWIISIEKNKESNNAKTMNQVLMPNRTLAEKKVFKWIPFKRSYLL